MSDNGNPHKLDPAENERVFRERILPNTLKNNSALLPSDTPTMLAVGGQPGAGKSNAIKGIEAEFADRGGLLVVDLDALRENHPKHNQLMRADDKAAAQYTYDDARIWAQKLEDYAKANRHNVLVESLMTSPDGVGGWLQDYREAGYRTEAHVVAVNERSSVQGIVQRYEGQKAESLDNVGRTVPRQVHDLAYDRVRDTFDRIETDKLSDRVVVHDRNGQVLSDNHLQANGQWEHAPGSARAAIEAERGRSLSPTQWRDHILTYDDIQANQRRPERGAAQAELDEVRQLRTASVREGGLTAQAGLHPVLTRTAAGAGVLATAYDGAVTVREAWTLHEQDNAVGAESKIMQFGARNAGAWGGALVGAKAGTLAGIESGPGMLVTGIVGAGIGAWGAERVVDWIEQNKINTQTDRNGVQWRFDPEKSEKGWQRDVVDAFAERGLSLKHTETAPPDIADELNFKASAMAVELRLSSPDIPVKPYEIAADSRDPHSYRESPWIRDPETKQWHREVADGMIDRAMHTYTDKAIGEKPAELDAYAQSVIVYNAARSPAAVAAHFEGVYRDHGWERHGDGQLPPAVRHAREDLETLVASDGDRYRRQQTGEWVSDGLIYDSTAQGNLRDELNATHSVLQARLMPAPPSRSVQEPVMGMEPRAFDPASEQQRDAREQAQREANRHGMSQDEVQQAVQGATATIAMRGSSSANAADVEATLRQDEAPPVRQTQPSPQAETLPPPPMRDTREEDSPRERESAQRARMDATAPLPPDFAPSQQSLRDLRDPQHEGHDPLREMQHRAKAFETQHNIPQGPHTERLGASMLQFAVENGLHYSDVRLAKHQDTGQIQLEHARYGHPTQRFPADMAAMSSQPIEMTSQRINATVSPHNASPAPALERTREQAQGLSEYAFDDKVLFARIRGGTPGHISDDHVALATREAKENGINANTIAQISMVGDQIRMVRSGPDDKTVLVDVSQPAPSLRASVDAVNTLNQHQVQALAQAQNNPTQYDPGLKGPRL
jgi:hypothetical protein